jgi:hypothetical protein
MDAFASEVVDSPSGQELCSCWENYGEILMLARKKKPRQGRAGRGRRLLEAEVLGCNTIAA